MAGGLDYFFPHLESQDREQRLHSAMAMAGGTDDQDASAGGSSRSASAADKGKGGKIK